MTLESGTIVQITDASHHWFPALIIVDEPKSFGCLGYTLIVNNTQEPNGQARIRLRTEEFEVVGKAAIVAA